MVKAEQDIIKDFNELVNMTTDELDKWLKGSKSKKAGWTKEGDSSGEAIGHESGRKILEILKKNSSREPEKYDKSDVDHMRRVVAYCKRHLAQERKLKDNENYEDSKSYISLKNWGHDPLKKGKSAPARKETKPSTKGKAVAKGKAPGEKEEKATKKEPAERKRGANEEEKDKVEKKPAEKKTKVEETKAGPAKKGRSAAANKGTAKTNAKAKKAKPNK